MPRNRKKLAHKLSEAPTSPRLPLAEQYFGPISVYPSIYHNGTRAVEPCTPPGLDEPCRLSSIVSQAEYSHLSPEVRYYSCARVFTHSESHVCT
jgi:hypothetical protein